MMKTPFFAVLALAACGAAAQEKPAVPPPAPFGVVPTARQLRWHAMEYYGFVHFTVNTFTDKEWGGGEEDPKIFNPSELDARQWARAARDAGMKGLILTAKHHDGFCLWPSKYTEHSVRNSPWKGGKGDLMRHFADACREFGLKVGVYLSPWDRNHAQYARPEYVEYYRQQLDELLTQYGEIFEVWHDGANGGTGYYGGAKEKRTIDAKTYYGFPVIWDRVRKLQPDAVIFSDAGPDIRWVGNERGIAPDPCWARINPEGIFPGIADTKRLSRGDPDGAVWRPAEVDVSIRKGWFFHANEQPKSLRQLLDIWYASVGNGCCLLLNVPPDRRGLFHEEDVKRLAELRAVLDDSFRTDLAKGKAASASNVRGHDPAYAAGKAADGDRASFWATDDAVREATLTVELGAPARFNRVRLQEPIELGQRVASFVVEVREGQAWKEVVAGKTIGARRLLRFPAVTADAVRVTIRESLACPALSVVEVYMAAAEEALGR
jgi:alpha-L-fucosidase